MQTFAKSTKVKTAKLAEKGPPPNTALFSSIYGMPQFFSFGLRTWMCAFLRLAHLPSSIGSLSYTAVTLVAPPPCLPVSPSGGLLPPPHSPSHSFLPILPLLHLSWFTFLHLPCIFSLPLSPEGGGGGNGAGVDDKLPFPSAKFGVRFVRSSSRYK